MTVPLNSRGGLAAANSALPDANVLTIDFPNCVAAEFPAEFPVAWRAVAVTLDLIAGADLAPLARRSPGLAGYDWTAYLKCSVARMVRTLSVLRARVPRDARILDCGAYFGNFARMLREAGYTVDAADSYGDYSGVFDPIVDSLRQTGAGIIDTTSENLAEHGGQYDAALLMGVIEHVPHTPRRFLETVDAALRPGGVLILDTPNLGYLYTRQRLARGESIFCPIALQYYTDLPFEGHHREFTIDEVTWILGALGHEGIQVDTFNYSFYGLSQLAGIDLENHRRMSGDPSLREVILASSRKPTPRK